MKKFFLSLVGLFAITAVSGYFYIQPPKAPNSQVFINATVLTMDTNNTIAEAVALRDNKIFAIGSTEEISKLIESDTVVHDLQGKTLLPGFIDAHGHFPGSGAFKVNADLRSPPMGKITTITELQNSLRTKLADKEPGEWIIGMGYDDTLLAEKRHPSRQDLDAISTKHPIYIIHTSGHMGVANSLALKTVNITIDTEAPVGGVIVKDPNTGELTGLLEETAQTPLLEHSMDFSASELKTLLFSAVDEYAAAGMTTAQSGGMPLAMLKGISGAAKLGLIPFRLELWPMLQQEDQELYDALTNGTLNGADFESDMAQINRVKIVADGSIQGFTGYLAQPYHSHFRGDEYYSGYPIMPREVLVEQVESLHKHGYRIAIHGNGDAAIDDIIYAFEEALKKYPSDDPRFIVIHSQMAREDQLVKMKQLGITPSFFSAHTYYWGDRHRDIFMGPERAYRMSPTKSAENMELRFSVHMDTPVAPMEPMTLVWSTVNRQSTGGDTIGSEQQVSPMTALRAVTIDAAYQIFRDHELGSIEAGKLADLVVLDNNPTTVEPLAIKDIQVEQTIVNGVTIFKK